MLLTAPSIHDFGVWGSFQAITVYQHTLHSSEQSTKHTAVCSVLTEAYHSSSTNSTVAGNAPFSNSPVVTTGKHQQAGIVKGKDTEQQHSPTVKALMSSKFTLKTLIKKGLSSIYGYILKFASHFIINHSFVPLIYQQLLHFSSIGLRLVLILSPSCNTYNTWIEYNPRLK